MDKGKLRVITGSTPVRRPDLELYRRALLRFHGRCGEVIRPDTMEQWSKNEDFKKFLFLTVRFVRYGRKQLRDAIANEEDAKMQMDFMFSVLDMVSLLTPRELMQMFPVEKRYDGDKYQEKDYFYTMENLQGLNWDEGIRGQMDVFELLYDYQNIDLNLLMVEVMMSMSIMRQFQGGSGIMEEFIEEQGVTPHILHEKEGYLYDPATGKSQPVIKPKKRVPKWVKVIEGGAMR